MKILLLGGGGREHALAWKMSLSPRTEKIYVTSGANAGLLECCEEIAVKAEDAPGLAAFAKEKGVGLVMVGPEAPLCAGVASAMREAGLAVIGPDALGARLEGSKIFAKKFMRKYGIPTADFEVFSDPAAAKAYVKEKGGRCVVKADGLAAGKGVFVCGNVEEGLAAVKATLEDKEFGAAGNEILIEELLEGEEASILAFTDGKTIVPLESAQDHKRVFDDDKGPNTGGMGAYSPAPVVTKEILDIVREKILKPTLKGIQEEKMDYRGVIYAGLMIGPKGVNVLEYNVRFGDPETQAVLPRLASDLVEVFSMISERRLSEVELKWDPRPAVCVIMASAGYPGKYAKGLEIKGLAEAKALDDTIVFQAGTKREDGRYYTSGGRVLGVTALGADIRSACAKAYEGVGKISFEGAHYRKDIAAKALKKL
jgi:phosphoribosylamine--glycine ligase